MKKITFIINPLCKLYKNFKKHIVLKQLPDTDYDVEFLETSYHQHAVELTQQAVHNNSDIIIAVGGNSTVNQVATQLTYSNIQFGIIPTTIGSGVARFLGIPYNIEEAIEVIKKQHTKLIDVGVIENNLKKYHFISNTSLGASAAIAHRIGNKPIKYFRDYILALFPIIFGNKRYKPVHLRFNQYDETIEYDEIFIGNIDKWGGPLPALVTQTKVDDGALDIVLGLNIPNNRIVSFIISYFFSMPDDFIDQSDTHKASTIHIKTEQPTKFQVDFEPILLNGDIQIDVLQKSLNVIIPK